MDTQQYRRLLKKGDQSILHKDYKGIEWAERELKRVRKISDLEEQVKEAERIWQICDNVYNSFHNLPEGVNASEPYGFNHFKRLYESFKYLKNKSIKTNKNEPTQDNKNDEITLETSEVRGNNQKEYITCQQCFKEIKAGNTYWHHKSKNDNHKFCSTNCYQEYYGEYCSKCVNENKNYTKYLNIIHDGDNSYCSACYQLEKPEQEWNPTIYCRYCSTQTELFEVCDKKECLERMNEEIEGKKNKNNNPQEKKNIPSKQQLQSQITNLENKPNKTKEEQAFLEEKKKELEELLKRQNSSNVNNSELGDKTVFYIGCGVIVLFALLLVFVLTKNRKRVKV